MKFSKLSVAIIFAILGIVIGFLSSEGIRGLVSNEKQLKSRINELLSSNVSILSTPIDPVPANAIKKAHEYSVAYRKKAGYCDYVPPTPLPTPEFIPINVKGEGFMQLTLDNAIDIVSGISNIGKLFDPSNRPTMFRLINGNDNGKNILMIVAVDTVTKKEITEIKSSDGIIYSLIQRIDGSIDCPLLCDFTGSSVIESGPTLTPCTTK